MNTSTPTKQAVISFKANQDEHEKYKALPINERKKIASAVRSLFSMALTNANARLTKSQPE